MTQELNKDNQGQEVPKTHGQPYPWNIFKHREEYEQNRDNRELKHWVIKSLVGSLVFSFAVIVLSMSYTVVVQGKPFNESVLGSFLNSFVDLTKFILS